MQLLDLSDVVLNSATDELISDTTELARKVNEFIRPLAPDVVEGVRQRLLKDLVFSSNAIEGNTLTLRETRRILETGSIMDTSRRREAQEVIGLGKAIDYVQGLVARPDSISDQAEFLKVHKILFTEIDPSVAGRYRNEGVMIRAAKHQPPDPSRVHELMDRGFAQLAQAGGTETIKLAAWTHWRIARIHPFFEGNGRMARLWQDLILFSREFTAAIIPDRTDYYNALTTADDGDLNPLAQLIAQRVSATLQVYITAQQAADTLKDWAKQLVGESTSRVQERRKLEYMRWVHQMDHLRDAFERCASQITNASAGAIEIQIQQYPMIDQSAWEALRTGMGAKKTWFFQVICRRGRTVLRYFFFFGRHFWNEADQQLASLSPNVCLLVSEQQGEDPARRLDEIDDTPLSIRELFVVDNQVVRKRWDMENQAFVNDIGIDAIQIAQQFLQEVLLKRLV